MKKLIILLILLIAQTAFGAVTFYDPVAKKMTVYKGRNATYQLKLSYEGTPLTQAQIQAFTNIVVIYNDEYIDMTGCPTCFDNSATYAANGAIKVDLGTVDWTAGTDSNAKLIAYDATYTNGRVIGEFRMTVEDDTLTGATLVDPFAFVSPGTWNLFYSDGDGVVQKIGLGAAGYTLQSNGPAVAPSFTPTGAGDMVKSVYDTDDSGVVDEAEVITNQGDMATIDDAASDDTYYARRNQTWTEVPVTSVNNKTGAVSLDADDLTEGTNNKFLTSDERQAISDNTAKVTFPGFTDLATDYGFSESDPVFGAWDKSTGINIQESQITDLGSYLTSETDPIFSGSSAAGITGTDISTWNSALQAEDDPSFDAWLAATPPLYPGGWYDALQSTISLSGFNDDLSYQAPLTADLDYLTPGTAASTYHPLWDYDYGDLINTPTIPSGNQIIERIVSIKLFQDDELVSTGDGKFIYFIPALMNGWKLVAVSAGVSTVSSSGTPEFQIHNLTNTQDMLSTTLTIDATEYHSKDATTAAVINATYNDVATGDRIRIDCDTAGTGTKGAQIDLIFQLP